MNHPPTKVCPKCKIEKSVDEFYRSGDGYHSRCKDCSRAEYNEWRRKNRKKHAERNNEWHHANRERSLAQQASYRARLGEGRKPRRVAEYDKHGEKIRARALAWAKANPEKRQVQHQRRAAAKRNRPCDWTVEQRNAALAYWKNCCAVCGVDLDGRRHWDHWIPLTEKTCPGTVATNMIPLCGRCNMRKHHSMPLPWLKLMFPQTWREISSRIESYLKSQRTK